MTKAKKDELKLAVQEVLNGNEDLLQSLVNKSVNGKLAFNQSEVHVLVDAILDSIVKLTDEHDELSLVGFGKFKAVRREQRKGRNPQTGEEILIPAKRVPKFEVGKAFKDQITQ